MLSAWLIKIITSSWGKSGIEQAEAFTADKPVTVSGAVEEMAERVFVKKIKEGLEMKFLKPGEDM